MKPLPYKSGGMTIKTKNHGDATPKKILKLEFFGGLKA
jgi:hypothetical protein